VLLPSHCTPAFLQQSHNCTALNRHGRHRCARAYNRTLRYVLSADSDEEQQAWMTALLQALP
jgi:hypothetical protein